MNPANNIKSEISAIIVVNIINESKVNICNVKEANIFYFWMKVTFTYEHISRLL